jgi:hypothetical protein
MHIFTCIYIWKKGYHIHIKKIYIYIYKLYIYIKKDTKRIPGIFMYIFYMHIHIYTHMYLMSLGHSYECSHDVS